EFSFPGENSASRERIQLPGREFSFPGENSASRERIQLSIGLASRSRTRSSLVTTLNLGECAPMTIVPPHSTPSPFRVVADRFGILTAHHVADILCKDQSARIGVIIAGHEHSFAVRAEFIKHHEIGQASWEDEASGPDLSFLQLLDRGNIGTLKS